MMNQAKYIIVQYGSTELPVVFPTLLEHSDVAAKMNGNVVSAGFVSFGTRTEEDHPVPTCQAYGKSITLGIASHKDDYKIINHHLIGF